MRTTERIDVPAPATAVFAQVEALDTYPDWLSLVHSVEPAEPAPSDTGPAWTVELRAKVGPFARSKRLRMVRTEHVAPTRVVFERGEVDGRQHAAWVLRAELAERAGADGPVTELTMHLAYDGALWTGGLLERVLDEHVREGREGLSRIVSRR